MALESKKAKLEEQTREAEFLHQNTDRRRRVIRKLLAKYLNDDELVQVTISYCFYGAVRKAQTRKVRNTKRCLREWHRDHSSGLSG